ncbi:MAG: RsmD family RNA methyltransferase [Mesonia hippocampi]|uniref:RsmD family RNA methyltransferase n=1 Tax=Mesonia hippocampi TaxID=1628250 RepID=UPI003F97F9AE
MRIISGTYRGKRIIAPKNLPIRPTKDMAKEALFNILTNKFDFQETKILDLFSGSGNITYEFISRGSTEITAVDSHYACVKFIQQTTTNTFNTPIDTIKSDVFAFLAHTAEKFDIIFADPPYDFSLDKFTEIADLCIENKLLNLNGVLIIEHDTHTDLSVHSCFVESRKYGGTVFSFFKNI